MERIVYHLMHTKADNSWYLKRTDRGECGVFGSKDDGLEQGRFLCRAHVAHNEKAQLIVHREDGSIEREFPYGADSRRSPGVAPR